MTTLVTGGSGFLGLALAERLLARGERVVLFDRGPPPTNLVSHFSSDDLLLVTGDVCSGADVDKVLNAIDLDHVIHAAAITPDIEREVRDPLSVVDVNVSGTVNLVQRCAVAKTRARRVVKRVLVVSSVAVYGVTPPAGDTYDEVVSHTAPLTLYGITKLASEQSALRLASLYDLNVCVARLGPMYGPWEHQTTVRDALSPHAQVLDAAARGEVAVLPRSMCADWIYSRDASEALVGLVMAPRLQHAIYNVGGAVMTDLLQWCKLIARHHPSWSWRQALPSESGSIRYGLPVDRAALAVGRLQADTGWSPGFSLEKAASDHLTWHTTFAQQPSPA